MRIHVDLKSSLTPINKGIVLLFRLFALVWFHFYINLYLNRKQPVKRKTDQLLLFLAGIWEKRIENGKELKSDKPRYWVLEVNFY